MRPFAASAVYIQGRIRLIDSSLITVMGLKPASEVVACVQNWVRFVASSSTVREPAEVLLLNLRLQSSPWIQLS